MPTTKEVAPSTSVIIPTYNRENTIIDCLISIVGQTLKPTQVVIVDDGSTDQTELITRNWIQSLRSNNSPEIIYVKQDNQGKSVALNRGFEQATAEWIAFNDSDDIWSPNKLELQFDVFSEYPECKVCFSDTKYVNNPNFTLTNLEIRGFSPQKEISCIRDTIKWLAKNPNGLFMQSLVAHRSVVEKVLPLNPDLRVAQDIDLIFRLSLHTDFCFINKVLVDIDRTPTGSNRLTCQHDLKSYFRLLSKETIIQNWIQSSTNLKPHILPYLYRQLSKAQSKIAKSLRDQGKTNESTLYLNQSLKNNHSVRGIARYLLAKVGYYN